MKVTAYVALVISTLIASGTFLVAKKTTEVFDPVALGWFRIQLSFLIIVGLHHLRLIGRESRWPSRRQLGKLALLGLCGVSLNQMLFLIGIHYASPTDAALLYAFTPVLVLVAAHFLYATPIRVIELIGMV